MLKLRAWDKKEKIMLYDFQFIILKGDRSKWILSSSDKYDFCYRQFTGENPYVIMLGGLTDKNGKIIYENDIVKLEDMFGIIYGVVERGMGGFGIKQLNRVSKVVDGFEYEYTFYDDEGECFTWGGLEVIGNIFEGIIEIEWLDKLVNELKEKMREEQVI